MKRFSDFATEQTSLEGDKIKIDDILNRDIEIIAFRITHSKFPKGPNERCLTLQFQLDGVVRVLFTGSDVLARQIERYASEIPFTAKIKKVNRYYTLY